ncbi:hypothetical protein [Chitinophaga eiseniae]|uniref:Uncharacterized protein n=1 Tax=Chitinophaga eiseniae TaxID=634771 RepID=A0A847SW71_9BACT|nr:hypothetical protein [Chitinophaga eiseniae]NLR82389.1 hypothetical protein [Chitinophaga eiseniae]
MENISPGAFSLFVCFFFCNQLNAQHHFQATNIDSVNYYAKILTDSSINWIYGWENWDVKEVSWLENKKYPHTRIDSVKIYPVVKFVINVESDTLTFNGLLFNDSAEVCVVAYPFLKVYGFFGPKPEFAQLAYGDGFVAEVHETTRASFKNSYFCYFLDYEKHARNILFEANERGIGAARFWYKSKEYTSLQDLIVAKYGSVNKFQQLRVYEEHLRKWKRFQDSVSNRFNIPLNYKSFVKGDWQFRNKVFPEDTVENIDFFIQKIKEYVPGVSHMQWDLLHKGIYSGIRNKEGMTIFSSGYDTNSLYFMGKDILSLIKSSLNASQLTAFIAYARCEAALYPLVDNYIFTNLFSLTKAKVGDQRMSGKEFLEKQHEFIKSIMTQD